MSFNIKSIVFIVILMLCSSNYAQNDTIAGQDESFNRLRRNVTEFFIQNGSPTGDNYAGNGLDGGIGFGMRSQWYVYDGIYAGGALSNDFMKVSDTEVIGNFDRATKFNAYLFIGYDYKLADLWHLTADIGLGYSQNKNRQGSGQGFAKFRDSGTLFRFTTSIEFEVTRSFSAFFSPSFETVDYKIKTAPSLGSQFDTGNYFNLALGVRFTANGTSLDKLKRDINKIERIPAAQRKGQQRIKLKYLKKRLARRTERRN